MTPALAAAWLYESVIGIEVWQFIGLAVLAVIIAVLRFALLRIASYAIRQRTEEERHEFWAREQKRLDLPVLLIVAALTILVGFPVLDFDPDVENVVKTFASLASALAATLLGLRMVDVATDYWADVAERTDSQLDDQLVPLARTAGKVFVGVVGAIFVLQNLNINITSLVAGLGIGGVAVALASQDSIKNLLGGATILADKPFQVGDWVVIGGYEGTVEQVGFRSTRIRTFADSLITMPNARITDTEVNNMGRRSWRRYSTTLGLAYYTDPDRIQAFVEGVRAIVRANPKMRHDYYIVEFITFAASSLNIMVYTFIDAADWNEELRTRHIFNLDILRLAERLEVDFAFPTQTLHVAETPGRPPQLPPSVRATSSARPSTTSHPTVRPVSAPTSRSRAATTTIERILQTHADRPSIAPMARTTAPLSADLTETGEPDA